MIRRMKWFCAWVLLAGIGYRMYFPDSQGSISDQVILSWALLAIAFFLFDQMQELKSFRFGPLRIAFVVTFGIGALFFFVMAVLFVMDGL